MLDDENAELRGKIFIGTSTTYTSKKYVFFESSFATQFLIYIYVYIFLNVRS